MRSGNDGIDQLMFNIDINNTIHGGSIQTAITKEEYEDEYVIEIRVPSIKEDHLKLRVFNRVLLLLHRMDYEVALNGQIMSVTRVLQKIPLPAKGSVVGIDAMYKGQSLFIFIPKSGKDSQENLNYDIEIN